MMRGHVLVPETFAEMSGHALGHAPRVDEHQRRLVLANQRRDAVVDFFPNFIRHHSFQRRAGNLHRQIQLARVPGIDDRAAWRAVSVDVGSADQKTRDFFNRLLRR